jgi:hypothetical protein
MKPEFLQGNVVKMLKSLNVLDYLLQKMILSDFQKLTNGVLFILVTQIIRNLALQTKKNVVFAKEASVLNGCNIIVKLVIAGYIPFFYQIKVFNFVSISQYFTIYCENFKFNVLEKVSDYLILDM